MYAQSSILIAVLLFLALVVATEIGYRTGVRRRALADESAKSQINTIQTSLLGMLALLLGFTFSLALQRYDSRSAAVVDEANAIGTAHLRAQLLPAPYDADARVMLRTYLDLRVQAAAIALDSRTEWESLLLLSTRNLDDLWQCAQRLAETQERPIMAGLFVESLNELIDAFGRRNAALNRHVPELVLFLLFATFVLTGSLVGYTSGMAGRRASFATYVLIVLIVTMVFLIIDLDRPRRGLIVVSQKSLIDLQTTIRTGAHGAAGPEDATSRGAPFCRR